MKQLLGQLMSQARRGARKAMRHLRGNPLVTRIVKSRFWRNRVFEGVLTTLVVITITGVFSPAQFMTDVFDGVAGVFDSEPPAPAREVASLFDEVRQSASWRFPPSMSGRARSYLGEHWESLRPDTKHPFPHRWARWRDLDEILQDTSLDGHPLLMSAYVDQTYGIAPVRGRPGEITAGFRISTGDTDAVGWCAPMLFKRGEQPVVHQLVGVKGTVIARGDKPTAGGGFLGGSYMVCSALNRMTEATASAQVADLFEAVEGDSLWREPPSMSEAGRIYLLYHWDEATPLKTHAFGGHDIRWMGIDQLLADRRFDGGEVAVAGYVTQRSLDTSYRGAVSETFRLEVAEQQSAVWCRATLRSDQVVQEGEHIEAVGVPVARGTSSLATGGFKGISYLACRAVRAR